MPFQILLSLAPTNHCQLKDTGASVSNNLCGSVKLTLRLSRSWKLPAGQYVYVLSNPCLFCQINARLLKKHHTCTRKDQSNKMP